ncbi:AAA family ATPase [Arachidicoccus ginsenosidivorans]|uniref:AAA family ATPase n=2 Tax=Arachidicoccus ginsenosidivorans TaxID=496057 RepID=A0A5B8VKZ1_9BACT|nr:AAA family ATPase [Arachidicoccus ginsenosidivorans]
MLQQYPIGLQSFQEIREGGYLYIDKTEIIHKIVSTDLYYFLSRPRRFGKSLLVDTIEELFKGRKELFEGLWIYDKWDWAQTSPVIHFDFSKLPYKEEGLSKAITYGLNKVAKKYSVILTGNSIKVQFQELIESLSTMGNVVILIDEYDKPIIDFLEEPELADANRSIMKDFYSIIKGSDTYIRFLLITGISQFSQVSVFSDLNNLDNITLEPQYGGLIGITQQELEANFSEEIAALQKDRPDILTQIKDWYDGYTWDMKTWVYNPFSLLNFMVDPEFDPYWYETGTPTFLIRLLKKEWKYDVETYQMGKQSLSNFNTVNPNMGALLFQTGYLTIKNISPNRKVYDLGFPNLEVKSSFLDGLLGAYRGMEGVDSVAEMDVIKNALREGDMPAMILGLNAIIAKTPYDLWRPDTESIFHAQTSLIFRLLGVEVYSEVHSAQGRCDVLVKTAQYIYVLELKLDGTAAEALKQIKVDLKARGYLTPYAVDPRKKIAVGISFSSKTRQVEEYEVEQY